MQTKLSSKGQVVIPKPLREILRLRPGTRFHVEVVEGKIILEPIARSPIESLYGRYADTDLLADLEAEHRQEITRESEIRA